jgi:hypothetical protein
MNTLVLESPLVISPSLLPGVRIGEGWLELSETGFRVLLDGNEYPVEDYRPGAGSSMRMMFADILGFLSHWVSDPDSDLFDEGLRDWAGASADDISVLEMELDDWEG